MDKILDHAKNVNKIKDNKYFIKLNNKPTKDSFIKSQEAFINAVDMWSKALATIMTKLPTYEDRLLVLENLWDEHGCGDLNKCHVNTFRLFISDLGRKGRINTGTKYDSYDKVMKFNSKILEYVQGENWIKSVAMLGMIEYTYIDVSSCINKYVNNFIEQENINHYTLHETLDEKHARDLFKIIEAYYFNFKEDILEGINDGYKFMDNLYEDLCDFLE